MTRKIIIWGVVMLGLGVRAIYAENEDHPPEYMSKEDREILKEEARDMFYHAYNAYMDNAYPADELMPLSCKGRYRGSEPDRGDIDSTLGNFSLTLVDTLDTLVVLGDLGEFENAVRLVVKDVTFDTDVIVSLFETNIRMLGGLLSGHILAEYLQSRADIMPWYRGELLNLAKDLGYRFLPAFNTTTGIPFGRINLRHGMKGVPAEMCRETCTACAGSMILEMAALSRLTGESIFEDKAQRAMDALWKMRHRGTDLMGSVLNVHSGDWVRRDSGVGAGIDSYYEYCLKAYILLGDEKYLGRFNKHYQAVMKYVSQGPMLLDVHMHRPNTNSKNFMDALLAFWPGLQVLKGDIKPAVETHEMLYQVMQRHNFIPEAFTTDFQVHWGHHPLRPEFLESTYFLYRATGDHYYLGVGRKVLKSLQTYARVPCGYAAVSDVRTNKHDDTMESFVLSETLKYLYLLFAEPSELVLDIDEFIFTTEGHLLPLTLAAARANVTADLDRDIVQVDELGRTCPNSLHLFPASVRQPLRNMVEDVCPRKNLKRRLNASQFQANNLEHLKILSNMGITILTPTVGRVQVLHTFSNARTAQDAEEGLLFMQEMVELSKKQSQQSETRAQSVTYERTDTNPPRQVTLVAGPANFGPSLKDGKKITGKVDFASPSEACEDLVDSEKLVGKIVMVTRGNCMFIEKARRIQKAGAIAGIVLDTVMGSSAAVSPMFAMSGDGKEPDDVTIPMVFLFNKEATDLIVSLIANDGSLTVTIGDYTPRAEIQLKAPDDLSVFERLKGSLKDFLVRQITPQNLGVTRPSGIQGASETPKVPEEGSSTYKTSELVEYKVPGLHVKALIQGKSNFVKFEKTDSPPPSPSLSSEKIGENVNELDKAWRHVKQNLVDTIFEKSSITLSLNLIRFQYSASRKRQGHNDITPSTTAMLVEWLLRELSDVAPSHDSKRSNDSKRDTTESRVELPAQTRSAVETPSFDEANNDLILETLNIIMKNDAKREEAIGDDTSTIENVKELMARIGDNEKLKNSVESDDEELKEGLARDLNVDYLDFELSLVENIDEPEESSSTSDEKVYERENERDEKNEDNTIIRYRYLKGTIIEDRQVLRTTILDIADKNNELPDLEEVKGRLSMYYMISSIQSDDKKSQFFEIPLEVIDDKYNTFGFFTGHDDYRATLRDKIIWYFEQICKVDDEQYIIDLFTTSEISEDHRKKIEELKNLNDIRHLAEQHRKITFFVMNEIGQNNELGTNDEERRTNEDKDGNDKTSRNAQTFEGTKLTDNQSGTEDSQGSRGSQTEEDSTECLTTRNEIVEKSRCSKKVKTSDPLEEFKKPVWAPDDGKDVEKESSRFHEKSNLPNSNYEYRSKHTTKAKNLESTTRQQGSKRIEDDL